MSSQTIKELYEHHEGKTSDKWSLYLDEYDKIFAPYRHRSVRFLEIGVQNGGSLDIWGHYFSQAEKIIGCDIDARCAHLQYDDPRIVVIVGDANSDECEQKILAQAPGFEIIIDDGSHRSSDIGRSFARYFRHLKDGGVYIVEDLHASYWEEFEGGLHHPGSIMGFLKRLADVIHHEHWQNQRTRRRRDLLASHELQFGIEFDEFELARIHSVEFINSLCIIRKLSPDQNVLGHRVVAGTEEYVNRGCKILDRTTIRDSAAGLKDDSDLEIFDLVQAKAERDHLVGEAAQLQAMIQEHQQTLVKRDEQIAAHVREQERFAGEIAAHVREQERFAGEIAAHVREQERLAAEIGQLTAEVQDQRRALAEGHHLAAKLQLEKDTLERDVQKQQFRIAERQQFLVKERAAYCALAAQAQVAIEAGQKELQVAIEAGQKELQVAIEAGQKELDERRWELDERRKDLDEKDDRIASLKELIQQREATLSRIYGSHGWKALTVYYQLRNKLLPEGTKRREIAKSFWKFLVKTSRLFPAANNGTAQSARTLSVEPVEIEPVIEGDDVPREEVTVSVVIPTKNGGEDFRRVLATIANQKGFRRVETIVVDSGSTDKTVELAEQFGSKIIKILPEEFSHSYARNLGASYASGEYLLFTVQDALPPSDSWLYELFSVIKRNDVVAVSCAEFPWESADLFYRAISWNHYRFLEVDREDRIMRYAGSEDHLTLRKNGQLSDLACLISKDVFTKYKYKTDYGEDLDLGMRLIKDGYKIAFLGSTRIIHSHNRPAYYYLKRGYVENVFLPRIFLDYPTVGNSLERVIPDMLVSHQVMKSMAEERTWDLQFPCKTHEFSNRIIERFQAASKAPALIPTQMVDGLLLDIEFQDFLDRLVKDYPVTSSDARPGDGELSEAVRDFTKMVLAYMEDSYEFVDDHIAGDFRLCLYKTFAYQCGAKLAQCSLRNDDEDRRKLEQIHGELSRGV